MNDRTFTCAQCGESFTSDWSDDEALAEAADSGFDLTDPDDLVVVCDDCYQKMSALIPPKVYTGIDGRN